MKTFKGDAWPEHMCLNEPVTEAECFKTLKEHGALEVRREHSVWRIWASDFNGHDGICQAGKNKKFYPSFRNLDIVGTARTLREWLHDDMKDWP